MSLALFEDHKYINKYNQPYWKARELAKILEYVDYRKFLNVITKAKKACENSWYPVSEHFVHVDEMVKIGSHAVRKIDNVNLSRYACYLIVQNADPSKEIVAQGQTYFAMQTRKQEITHAQELYQEDQKRVEVRKELAKHSKQLFSTAKKAGVTNYAEFQDAGYQGLYGGMRKSDLVQKKWIPPKEAIFDYMSSEELGANLFRATQADAKLKRDLQDGRQIGQEQAEQIHHDVGAKVRKTIQELGGTMPEELPVPDSVEEAEKRLASMSYEITAPLVPESVQHPEAIVHREGVSQESDWWVKTQENDLSDDALMAPILCFDLPSDIPTLTQLISIVKTYPGEEMIQIGDKIYELSSKGVKLVIALLEDEGRGLAL